MIVYNTRLEEFPKNCKECTCHWCRVPVKSNKYEPEVKRAYKKKRHEECPLMEI